jgi:hypothetical protein
VIGGLIIKFKTFIGFIDVISGIEVDLPGSIAGDFLMTSLLGSRHSSANEL